MRLATLLSLAASASVMAIAACTAPIPAQLPSPGPSASAPQALSAPLKGDCRIDTGGWQSNLRYPGLALLGYGPLAGLMQKPPAPSGLSHDLTCYLQVPAQLHGLTLVAAKVWYKFKDGQADEIALPAITVPIGPVLMPPGTETEPGPVMPVMVPLPTDHLRERVAKATGRVVILAVIEFLEKGGHAIYLGQPNGTRISSAAFPADYSMRSATYTPSPSTSPDPAVAPSPTSSPLLEAWPSYGSRAPHLAGDVLSSGSVEIGVRARAGHGEARVHALSIGYAWGGCDGFEGAGTSPTRVDLPAPVTVPAATAHAPGSPVTLTIPLDASFRPHLDPEHLERLPSVIAVVKFLDESGHPLQGRPGQEMRVGVPIAIMSPGSVWIEAN